MRILHIISGKAFFNALSEWTYQEYGVTISARQIIPFFYVNEVPQEIKDVIDALMQGNRFPIDREV